MKLTLASETDRKHYWAMAQAWSDQQDWSFYNSNEYPARKGLAEWFANQNGETCFESYVGRDYQRIRG